MLNPGPHHQLSHYVAALNLTLIASIYLLLFFGFFYFSVTFRLYGIFFYLRLIIEVISLSPLSVVSPCRPRPLCVPLSLSPLCPPHSANCYNSIVPFLPVGSDGINKAGFEIDFLSAPFWITLLRSFGWQHSSSSRSFCYHSMHSSRVCPAEGLQR